jgi:26S proteasome regulatory subunit T1
MHFFRFISCLIKETNKSYLSIDEVDAIGGARFDDGMGGDNEVQRTMLELINQLDGFDSRGAIKVLMATNRPDTLDPALVRPGRIDRRIEFGLV